MKLLFLGDLHGNITATRALEAVLPELGSDEIWFLGDAVGKGPNSAATCDWVRANCDHFIGGNWDYGIGRKEFPNDAWYWDILGEERLSWLASLPQEASITLSGLSFRLFHGRPVTRLLSSRTPREELQLALDNGQRKFDCAIFADSHRPFFMPLDHGYIMNTGSVGNSMGYPRVHCLMLEGGDTDRVPLRSTIISLPYDNEAEVREALRCDGLPLRDAYINEIRTGVYSRR